ncbi:DMT family transporter [Reichenbachiella sp.]|uniref:DMT family transporter n=2 Tax=Reichenbachiella sp. TaxID=2184521 RepID=UPI0032977CB9
MALYVVFIQIMHTCVKFIPHIPPEIIFFRSVIPLMLCLYGLSKLQINHWGNNKVLLISRGIFGGTSLLLIFYLLQKIPFATVTTFRYLGPIFSLFFGILWLNEKLKTSQWIYMAIALLGAVLVKGFNGQINMIDFMTGIIMAISAGLVTVIIKKMKGLEHPLVIIFYFPLVLLPISGTYSYFYWVQPVGLDWLILLVIGILTQLAQYYLTVSIHSGALSKVVPIQYSGIIISIVFGYFIFDESLGYLSLVGIFLVVSSLTLNNWENIKSSVK